MDPQHQWQQPDQTGPYGPQGQPPAPQYPPQQPQQQYPQPQYPQQQYSAQPYANQPYSALPYSSQPHSAPPHTGQPHTGQPYSGQPYPPQPYSGPPPRATPFEQRPKRNRWFAALVISAVLLVVMAIAVVVVATTRDHGGDPQAGGGASQSPSGPVDACLVGRWKQTSYQRNVVLGDTDVGKRENLGTIKMNGGGKQWTINADGSATEDDSKTVYSGKTTDGRTVTASFSGQTTWAVKTVDTQLQYAGKESNVVVTISVDGTDKGRIELEPNTDPVKYTCTGDIWRITKIDDPDAFSRYDRVK
ncbi:hypothetical protein Drose_11065 [Dactylosporangium roseum]|uniref:Uncharacterized protein n=1 Tax=Dactylosporangium roseum TaxID=47989 RepID=A0ABY5Z9H1_9ACTN|nr:hypothetical protein [Dactylosporangium roseum]UWZ38709.1 hypothetical protein Drose_11065 [Dactylosporangium roseum]